MHAEASVLVRLVHPIAPHVAGARGDDLKDDRGRLPRKRSAGAEALAWRVHTHVGLAASRLGHASLVSEPNTRACRDVAHVRSVQMNHATMSSCTLFGTSSSVSCPSTSSPGSSSSRSAHASASSAPSEAPLRSRLAWLDPTTGAGNVVFAGSRPARDKPTRIRKGRCCFLRRRGAAGRGGSSVEG